MSDPTLFAARRSAVLILALGLLGTGSTPVAARAAAEAPKRVVAGVCVTPKATMIRREAYPKPWQLVDQNEKLYTGDAILGLPGSELESSNGAVRLEFLADMAGISPYPVKECVVRLGTAPDVDLDFTLERGRADVINHKDKGAARVRVHVRDDHWDLTLDQPGTSVALEVFGRWPAGMMFTPEPGPKDVPTAHLVIVVLKGEMHLQHDLHEHAMRAPVGPAMIEWDSVSGQDATPRRLDEPPSWAVATPDTEETRQKKAGLKRFRDVVLDKGIEAAIDQFLKSDNPQERALAVNAMVALDDLPHMAEALRETRHHDVWDAAVIGLRRWIGRAPGQDQLLYKGFVEIGKYDPLDAETAMQMLHTPGAELLARPELYQALINYLNHDKLAIRGLAYWHLERLVPAGKEFGYQPWDPRETRDIAIQKWKKLIPRGTVPPRPKPAPEKKP